MDKNSINFISININSIKSKLNVINNMTKNFDIIFIQESMLIAEDVELLGQINKDFKYVAVPAVRSENYIGRPVGGLCILFHKKFSQYITVSNLSNFGHSIELMINNVSYYFINLYLQCDNGDNNSLVVYKQQINELYSIISNLIIDYLFIVGDFNADPTKGRFWNYLKDFSDELNLQIYDHINLDSNSFSYISPSHNSTSWLDHLIVSNSEVIKSCKIEFNYTFYDHLPISFSIAIKNQLIHKEKAPNKNNNIFIDWEKLSSTQINNFKNEIKISLSNYKNNSLLCKRSFCNDSNHKKCISQATSFFVDSMKMASKHLSSNKNKKTKKNSIKQIGWNKYCKNNYNNAKLFFKIWVNNGKIRHEQDQDYINMKNSRKFFRNSLNYCKKYENQIKNELLIDHFNSNMNNFWNLVKKFKNRKGISPVIDGFTDPDVICNQFKNKFCLESTSDLNTSSSYTNMDLNDKFNKINSNDILNCIKNLKNSLGPDHVHANLFKFASSEISGFLAKLFSSYLSHTFVPECITIGEINPIIKNKLGNKADSANFRPIMVSCNLLKLFEYCLLPRISNGCKISNRQFGFRQETSTIMNCWVVKECIHKYTEKGSPIYMAFLDLSKAYDRLIHKKLFTILKKAGIPHYLIETIKSLYCNQKAYIKYNGHKSTEWNITQGVRQGAILSPLLFSIYINDIIESFKDIDIGCILGFEKINILCYCDDMVIIAPSITGLRLLLERLECLLLNTGLSINADKSKIVPFFPKDSKSVSPNIYISGKKLEVVNSYKYLGIIISNNSTSNNDIERAESIFLKQFYSIYRKFYFINQNALFYLFSSHCTSFYGCPLWIMDKIGKKYINSLSVSYHNAIKKVFNLRVSESNHFICNNLGILIFKHFLSKRYLEFLHNLLKSNSCCFEPFKSYFKSESIFVKRLGVHFKTMYNIENILENDSDAVISRLLYVQNRENSSIPLYLRDPV